MAVEPDRAEYAPQDLINSLSRQSAARAGLPRATIIRAHEWQAMAAQQQALVQAREQAGEILRNARQQALSIAEFARTQGYAEGLARAQRDHALKVASQGLNASQTWASLEERMCFLVTRTLQKLLAEPQNDRHFFEAALGRVLAAARREPHLLVRVNPAQVDSARATVQGLLSEQDAPQFVEVDADPSLKLGGCIVESAHGVVDASLETQLDVIHQVLIGACRASDE